MRGWITRRTHREKPSPAGRGLGEGRLDAALLFHRSMLAWLNKAASSRRTPKFPVLVFMIVCTIGVINSRAHVDPPQPQTPQVQMQFPEGLDYSKFLHTSANHSRLPCLLCHRRD